MTSPEFGARILRDIAEGRVVLHGTFTPTPNELVEVTADAIDAAFTILMSIEDQTRRKRAGVAFIRDLDKVGGLMPGARAKVPFDEAGIRWLETVKVIIGRDIFNITPEMLDLREPSRGTHPGSI